jgi:RNA polymerase sigma factor (sigma-70 family)
MQDLTYLWRLCGQGDAKAQRILYDLFKGRLMGICRRYTKNREEAQDVLQEVFVRIFTKIGQLEAPEKLVSWMKSIAIHTAINHYHKTKNDKLVFLEPPEEDAGPAIPPIDNFSDDYLISLVNDLPDGCRMVFNLFVVEGYSHSEIAALLGIGEGTSRSQLFHAKLLLKAKLHCEDLTNYYEKYA